MTNMNIWKSLGNGFYENLVPVREKTTSRIYPAGSCQVTKPQQRLFEAVEE